jgi:hypothetical protein
MVRTFSNHNSIAMFTTTIRNIRTAKILLLLSILLIAFYFVHFYVIGDVYRYAIVGAIYELLWLPMLLCLFGVPFFSVIVFIKNKGKHRFYAALAILLIICSFIILINH